MGASHSKGEYIALLDDDDFWLPNKLEFQIQKMLENNSKFSSTEGYFGGPYDKNQNINFIIVNIFLNS